MVMIRGKSRPTEKPAERSHTTEKTLFSTRPSAAFVERFLKDVEYPATKADLIEQAEDNDAPEGVLLLLEQLNEIEYKSPIDIAKEVGRIQPAKGGGPSAAKVEHYIKGIQFPSSKDTILAKAKENAAPEEVMHVLDQLNDDDYKTVIDISRQMTRIQPSHRKRVKKTGGGASAATVEQYLKGSEFPADKRTLIELAEENNAPPEVLKLLQQFEEKKYTSPIDISKQIGHIKPRRSGKPSAAVIEHYIKGIEFPAQKGTIVEHAKGNGAPKDVLFILEQAEEIQYRSPIDIAKQIGHIKQSLST